MSYVPFFIAESPVSLPSVFRTKVWKQIRHSTTYKVLDQARKRTVQFCVNTGSIGIERSPQQIIECNLDFQIYRRFIDGFFLDFVVEQGHFKIFN